jgi:hypothetical protein
MDWQRSKRLVCQRSLVATLTLPSVARAHANVADPTLLDDIVKSLHLCKYISHQSHSRESNQFETYCFLNRRVIVESVALQDIDVIQLEAFQAVLDGLEDSL